MKYTDLIAGNIYRGINTGCSSKPIWLFKYNPINTDKQEGDTAHHQGLALCKGTHTEPIGTCLYAFHGSWDFSEASWEEKLLFGEVNYEIY